MLELYIAFFYRGSIIARHSLTAGIPPSPTFLGLSFILQDSHDDRLHPLSPAHRSVGYAGSWFRGMAEVYHSAKDFVLFPRDQSFPGSFGPSFGSDTSDLYYNQEAGSIMHPTHDFQDHNDIAYEAYPAPSAYLSSSAYLKESNPPFEIHKATVDHGFQHNSPSGSPSTSTSQTLDHPPSILSSASGASGQSTASSADGSPYTNTTHNIPYQEKWHESLHGLGLAPEVVNSESFHNDHFPSASIDDDLVLEDTKFASYVGEYQKNFSLPLSMSLAKAPSISPASASHKFVPAFPSPDLTLNTASASRDATIDSILEEANYKMNDSTHLVSPISVVSMTALPTSIGENHQELRTHATSASFRSPKTPASAPNHFSSPSGSPHSSSELLSQRRSSGNMDQINPQNMSPNLSDRFSSYRGPSLPSLSRDQALFEKTQNPFFGQSSGRFVAPLESSCWFSLQSPNVASVKNAKSYQSLCACSMLIVAGILANMFSS